MKKKLILVVIGITMVITAIWAASKVTLYDDCGKCKITATEHKCGKCGSSMNSSSEYTDGYLKITYTCPNSNCRHSCYTKQKR